MDLFNEVTTMIGKTDREVSHLATEAFDSMLKFGNLIAQPNANAITTIAKEFGDMVLVDNSTSQIGISELTSQAHTPHRHAQLFDSQAEQLNPEPLPAQQLSKGFWKLQSLQTSDANESAILGSKQNRDIINKQKILRSVYTKLGGEMLSDDRTGNFAIQTMMSDYNNAEAMASSIAKKNDDTQSGILSKI